MLLSFLPPMKRAVTGDDGGALRCAELAQYIGAYLDGEFDGEEAGEMRAHIRYCPHCSEVATRMEHDRRRLREGLRASFPPEQVPDALLARVQQAIASEQKMIAFERRTRDAAQRTWMTSLLRWAPAGGVLSLLFALLLTPSRGSTASDFVEDAVRQHAKNLPVEVGGDTPMAAHAWFVGKLDFGLVDPPIPSTAMQLVGARLSHVRHLEAAHFVYERGGRRCSVLAFEQPREFAPDAARMLVAGRTLFAAQIRGFNVVSWQQGPIAYSMVCDLPLSRMVELLGR